MITLTLNEATPISLALAQLPRIRAKAAYDLARIRDKLKVELKTVNEQRVEIIKAHDGEITDGGVVKWKSPDDQSAADAEFAELLTKEIEIDRNPVKLADVLGPDESKHPEIQPELLSILEKIIVE